MIARAIAITLGLTLLIAVAHVTVVATGGYGTPHCYLTLAIAAGVGVGGVLSGLAWSSRRYALAVLFVLAIVAGEAYGLLSTAERLITAREHAQAPLRVASQKYSDALVRVQTAKAALDQLPNGSIRLANAIASKATADAAVIQKSAERGCLANCRQLLQAQVDLAVSEVDQAREEIQTRRAEAERTLANAIAAVAALPVPTSATPFADRLGLAPWLLDLVIAALGSIASNGLAICLLVYGAHSPQRPVPPWVKGEAASAAISEAVAPNPGVPTSPSAQANPVAKAKVIKFSPRRLPPPQSPSAEPKDDVSHAAKYAVQRLERRPGQSAKLEEIHRDYKQWCASNGVEPLPDQAIALALADLFKRTNIVVSKRDGAFVAIDICLNAGIDVTTSNRSSVHHAK